MPTVVLCITQLRITKFSVLEIKYGRKFQSVNNCEGKILAVTKVLEVQTGSCGKGYACSLKYFFNSRRVQHHRRTDSHSILSSPCIRRILI
jgi:ribosomal protein L3